MNAGTLLLLKKLLNFNQGHNQFVLFPPSQMINFVGVLSFAESSTKKRFTIKWFILKHFNSFTSTSVVLGLFGHSKELAYLVLGIQLKLLNTEILYVLNGTHLLHCDWHHYPTSDEKKRMQNILLLISTFRWQSIIKTNKTISDCTGTTVTSFGKLICAKQMFNLVIL